MGGGHKEKRKLLEEVGGMGGLIYEGGFRKRGEMHPQGKEKGAYMKKKNIEPRKKRKMRNKGGTNTNADQKAGKAKWNER